jgi:hypothetical protein
MATFKVVLDGIELGEEQAARISGSIGEAVLHGLADHDAGAARKFSAEGRQEFSMVPIFKGETMGWVMREREIDDLTGQILGREFSG